MGEIEAVEPVEEWVFRHLSALTFSTEEQRLALKDIHTTPQFDTWNILTDAHKHLVGEFEDGWTFL